MKERWEERKEEREEEGVKKLETGNEAFKHIIIIW